MSLPRRLFAEFLGTAALVMVVIGSGLMGQSLSPDLGVVILINQISTVLGLGVLVALLIPISGAHINPAVTLIMILRRELPVVEGLNYVGANPVPIIVPCHRVMGSTGTITGYSGGDGIPTKRALLAHENTR